MTAKKDNLEFMKKCSEALLDEGSLEQAAEQLEKLVLVLEKEGKPEDLQSDLQEYLIDALEKLGACYYGVSDYSKTVSVYSRLVLVLDKKYGMEYLETIKAVYKLAKACEKDGQRELAQTMYYIAKEAAAKTLGEENFLRQTITGSYKAISRPKRVAESVNTFVAGDRRDPEALLQAAKSIPQRLRGLSTRGDIFLSVSVSLLLVIASGVWIAMEFKRREAVSYTESVTESLAGTSTRDARDVAPENSFSTVDGFLKMRFFSDKEAEIECDGKVIKVETVTLSDSIDSVKAALDSRFFGRRVFAELTPAELMIDGDLRLVAHDSLDMKLVEAADSVCKTLNDYYKEHNSYPDGKSDMIAGGRLSYTNPLSGKPQSVSYHNFSQFMHLDHIFAGAESMDDAIKFLRTGGSWSGEPALIPGAIHCVSRYSAEKRGDRFIVPSAIMHVADKNSQLLTGSLPGEVYLAVLERGVKVEDGSLRSKISDRVLRTLRGKTLFFVKSHGLFTNAWLWRNLPNILLSLLFFASLIWWIVFDARARLLSRTKPITASEVIVALTALLFLSCMLFSTIIRL